MPEFPICARCGYRHAIPRFADLQLGHQPPCDREPRRLGNALEQVYDFIEQQNRELLGIEEDS